MASMNSRERARLYLERLKKATNKNVEAKRIIDEINGLFWTKNQKKLSVQEKLELIAILEDLALHGEKQDGRVIVEASDNSDILEVIRLLKRGVDK